jgi:hypothetical protein
MVNTHGPRNKWQIDFRGRWIFGGARRIPADASGLVRIFRADYSLILTCEKGRLENEGAVYTACGALRTARCAARLQTEFLKMVALLQGFDDNSGGDRPTCPSIDARLRAMASGRSMCRTMLSVATNRPNKLIVIRIDGH